MADIYNPFCFVSYLYWGASGNILKCKDCPIDCECKKVRVLTSDRG